MYRIAKHYDFAAAHKLDLPFGHKCRNLHGHTYKVEIVLASKTLNSDGMVVDFCELVELENWINNTLDHSYLNDVLTTPTVENISKLIFDQATRRNNKRHNLPVESVRVWESLGSWGEYSR
jgi:6-pyruvoyltetrahydropterin/6-carboxytetrahydropterin synthase